MSDTDTAARRRWRQPGGWGYQLPLLVGLALLWMLLWDDFSWGNLLSGAALAVVVTRVFYLPPVELSGRFNPYWALVFVVNFALDLVLASWEVAVAAVRPGYVPHSAVIAINLRTTSDLIMTLTGQALTLIPGSLIVDVDRLNTTLYVHVFDAATDDEVEKSRRAILRTEERLIRAVGSRAECAALGADRAPTVGGSR